jgi:ABC-2 type transport system ATP-binding protein
MTAIEVQALRRVYRARLGFLRRQTKEVVAVDGIDFQVGRGELFGLVGPNGAGKTTTVKMLTTLLIPTSGLARVLGYDVVHETSHIRAVDARHPGCPVVDSRSPAGASGAPAGG